jgi:hypothetical protein
MGQRMAFKRREFISTMHALFSLDTFGIFNFIKSTQLKKVSPRFISAVVLEDKVAKMI